MPNIILHIPVDSIQTITDMLPYSLNFVQNCSGFTHSKTTPAVQVSPEVHAFLDASWVLFGWKSNRTVSNKNHTPYFTISSEYCTQVLNVASSVQTSNHIFTSFVDPIYQNVEDIRIAGGH